MTYLVSWYEANTSKEDMDCGRYIEGNAVFDTFEEAEECFNNKKNENKYHIAMTYEIVGEIKTVSPSLKE